MKNQFKILIVEDETSLRNALVEKFQKEGFIVFSAINGLEGYTIANKEHPAIILLDIVMPKMDGIEMLNKVRKDDWGAKVPVIILSNYGDEAKISQTLEQGVYEYLIKSDWSLEDIVKKVNEKLP